MSMFISQKHFKTYRVDLYFPIFRLAIECDEHGHKDRDKKYEEQREKHIKKLGITFIRFNPDDSEFNILDVVAKIHNHIMQYKDDIVNTSDNLCKIDQSMQKQRLCVDK